MMRPWPRGPILYEINTWPWLEDLGRQAARPVTLASVPAAEWDRLAAFGFDAVWLMGVWERSPAGIAITNQNRSLTEELRRTLPDFRKQDHVGSAYCIRRYRVAPELGGPEGLAAARAALAGRGLRLVLDFVPNHVAPDHPWTDEHPEFFIQGDEKDRARAPDAFVRCGTRVYACGRDPFFPAWRDVVQLNAFNSGLRAAARETLDAIAGQCDGVRCDMAMLVLNSVFGQTWGTGAGGCPGTDYWREIIPAVRAAHPEFKLIAEVYWDRERELHRQGFDFCYDKRLYDQLVRPEPTRMRRRLASDSTFQEKLVRFIENHDEPRAAATFAPAHARAAAVGFLTLPGAKLLHEGQIEGRKMHLPVCLGRRPEEPVEADLAGFYKKLLAAIRTKVFREGTWRLCHPIGWPDNSSYRNLVAWCWRHEDHRSLIVVNLSASRAQARVRMPWPELRGRAWRLCDAFATESYDRNGNEMIEPGLYVDLGGFGFHCFRLECLGQAE